MATIGERFSAWTDANRARTRRRVAANRPLTTAQRRLRLVASVCLALAGAAGWVAFSTWVWLVPFSTGVGAGLAGWVLYRRRAAPVDHRG